MRARAQLLRRVPAALPACLSALLLLLGAAAAAAAAAVADAPPAPLPGVSPAWADLARLAADATLAALRAEGGSGGAGDEPTTLPARAGAPHYSLEAIHAGSVRLTTGQEQAVTLDIDGTPFRLLLHDQDARDGAADERGLLASLGPDRAALEARARAVAAAAAATAAAAFPGTPGSPGDGWDETGAWPPAVVSAEADDGGVGASVATITPATAPAPPSLALPPFTVAGPLELRLVGAGAGEGVPLALRLPSTVELADPDVSAVRLPAGVAVRVVGAARAGLAPSKAGGVALGAPPPAWAAAAYGVAVDGVPPPPRGGLVPGAGLLAAADGARAAAERAAVDDGGAPPAVVLEVAFGDASAAAVEAAPHPDAPPGSPPVPLRARSVGGRTIELVPRGREGGGGAPSEAAAAVPARPRAGDARAWAWPLPGARGPALARFDAALMELVAAARATRTALWRRGGGGGDAADGGSAAEALAPPSLRLGAASSEAVAFVRLRLALRRSGPPDADAVAAAAAMGHVGGDAASGDPAVEHWEALVRVAPPTTPGGPPRVAALRADRVGAGGAGAPRSLTVSPLAEAALRGNATLPGDGELDFVYPVPGVAYGGGGGAGGRRAVGVAR